jgi:hypothetical protein
MGDWTPPPLIPELVVDSRVQLPLVDLPGFAGGEVGSADLPGEPHLSLLRNRDSQATLNDVRANTPFVSHQHAGRHRGLAVVCCLQKETLQWENPATGSGGSPHSA